MNNIFLCPKCKSAFALPQCNCGYVVPCINQIYQFTDDPYRVKDDSADIKYIGYEDIGKYYSGLSLYKKIDIDERHKKVAQLIGDGILLDLACGDGLYTIPFVMQGVKTISMDISDKMLSLLYKRAEIADIDSSRLLVCRANALYIPLCDCSVDAVIANSVLHLISKPELVLNEIYRVLKAGGKFITFDDSLRSNQLNENNISEKEKAQNKSFGEFVGFVHGKYFQKLNAYNIRGTRYSWRFDKDKICDEMFRNKETYLIRENKKIVNKFKDTFLYRMGGKGFSDQSDVPQDIHDKAFAEVMSEFLAKYGKEALNTVFTGYENDIEIKAYIK